MVSRKDTIKAYWATRNKEFKTVKIIENPMGEKFDTLYGRLRIGNEYYDLTERVGAGVMRYSQELNMMYRTGKISKEEFINLKSSMLEGLKDSRVRNVGRNALFFENLTKKTGINAKVFNSEKFKNRLDAAQLKQLNKFVKNMKELNKNKVMSDRFYKDVSEYFKDISDFYEAYISEGSDIDNFTEDDIKNVMGTIKTINEMYSKSMQTNLKMFR